MSEKPRRLQKYLTDRNISLVVRWWAAGAVYFFIGWGTSLGNQQSIIDFVVILGLIMGVFNILIINPGLRLMFNIGTKRPQRENTGWQRTSDYLIELLKNIFMVLVVVLIYRAINIMAISVFDLSADAVPLPGEPIFFGLFYVFVFVLLEKTSTKIQQTILKLRNKKSE